MQIKDRHTLESESEGIENMCQLSGAYVFVFGYDADSSTNTTIQVTVKVRCLTFRHRASSI